MTDYLQIVQSLDREINNIVSEYDNEGNESLQTKENTKDVTGKNVINTANKNVVDVTSKNFVSSESNNVIQSPFICKQQSLKRMTTLQKGSDPSTSSNIVQRISAILKF